MSTLDKDRFEAIEAYLLRSLTAEERSRFEQELAADASLRAEMELQRENTLAIELGGVQRLLKEVGADQAGTSDEGRRSWTGYLKYAAAAVVLITAALWWLNSPTANERLFAEHFSADPGLPVAMSATDDPVFQDAMVAYKLGDYAEARAKWSPLLQMDPTNDTLRYYIASATLAMNDATTAIPLFERLGNDHASAFHDKSQWFLFLAYVKVDDVTKAESLQLDDDPTYGERVRKIKAELRAR